MVLTFSLGILLVAGVIGGHLASAIGVPKVTLYIVAGLLIGPSVFHWLPEEHLHELDPVLKLALALVLLEIGSRFRFGMIRRIIHSAVPLSIGELVCTFTFVTCGVLLVGESPQIALLLGGLALATAPATTIVVLQEYNSEGPVTSYTYFLVALNNLAAIIGFEILFVAVSLFGPDQGVEITSRLQWLGIDLIGSTLIGILTGIVMSIVAALTRDRQRNLAIFAIAAFVLGLCETLNMPYLLAFLAMGVTFANTSQHNRETIKGLETVLGLLYVMFFVAAGAELDLQALSAVGLVGTVYVLTRSAGKYFGIRGMAWWRQEPPAVQRWLGSTLIAQAGAAIGLVQIASARNPELGHRLQTIIVGTVVVFEVIGPLLTRLAIVRAGEVPVAHLVKPEGQGLGAAVQGIVNFFRSSLGKSPLQGRNRENLTVGDLMRKNIHALSNSAGFMEVLDYIEHSRHQVYPVINADGLLVSLIRYSDLRTVLFDPEVAQLVRADDLCVDVETTLTPDIGIEEAFRRCETSMDDVIPVIRSEDDRALVGLLERRDVIRFVKADMKNGKKG